MKNVFDLATKLPYGGVVGELLGVRASIKQFGDVPGSS
jgi:hypothetical protein